MRSALLFSTIALTAALTAPAQALRWSTPAPAGDTVGAIDLDGSGLGAFAAGAATLVPFAADGTPAAAITYAGTDGPIAFDVSDTGRIAVIARLADGTLGLGTGTTAAPPTALEPFVEVAAGQAIDDDYRVAVGQDGRLLVVWAQDGDTANAAMAARLAPGAAEPELTALASYEAGTGYPSSFAIEAAAIDNSGRSAVAYQQSGPTGWSPSIRRTTTPDGPFGAERPGIAAGRYTAEPLTILESTGAVSMFAFGFNTQGGRDAVFTRRLPVKGKVSRDVTVARLSGLGRWAADVGANGSAAIAFTGGKELRVRTRTEAGRWDRKAQVLAPVSAKRRKPAVSVSKLGRKVVAYPVAQGVLHAFAKPGVAFDKVALIPGSNGCDKVRLAGAGSGRTVAVLSCGNERRLATTNAG